MFGALGKLSYLVVVLAALSVPTGLLAGGDEELTRGLSETGTFQLQTVHGVALGDPRDIAFDTLKSAGFERSRPLNMSAWAIKDTYDGKFLVHGDSKVSEEYAEAYEEHRFVKNLPGGSYVEMVIATFPAGEYGRVGMIVRRETFVKHERIEAAFRKINKKLGELKPTCQHSTELMLNEGTFGYHIGPDWEFKSEVKPKRFCMEAWFPMFDSGMKKPDVDHGGHRSFFGKEFWVSFYRTDRQNNYKDIDGVAFRLNDNDLIRETYRLRRVADQNDKARRARKDSQLSEF